jgi:hypothetical protein
MDQPEDEQEARLLTEATRLLPDGDRRAAERVVKALASQMIVK